MSFVHLHLVLTHFPTVLTLVALVAAASALVVRKRRGELLQLTLLLMVVTGAMMPAIYFAGVRTADAIGKVEGIQQEAIGPHQHAATIALSICMAVALVALGLIIVQGVVLEMLTTGLLRIIRGRER